MSKKKPAYEVFRGVDWSNSVHRPGCQDFLSLPSRRGDKLHAYRLPILNISSVKPTEARATEKNK